MVSGSQARESARRASHSGLSERAQQHLSIVGTATRALTIDSTVHAGNAALMHSTALVHACGSSGAHRGTASSSRPTGLRCRRPTRTDAHRVRADDNGIRRQTSHHRFAYAFATPTARRPERTAHALVRATSDATSRAVRDRPMPYRRGRRPVPRTSPRARASRRRRRTAPAPPEKLSNPRGSRACTSSPCVSWTKTWRRPSGSPCL